MKRTIETSILIPQSVENVWKTLMDYKSYSAWSPTIKPLSEFPEVGKNVKVLLTQPNGFRITMNPVILCKDSNKELRWKGKLFVKGLFDGEHYFVLNRIDANTTEFIQGEVFSGLLIPFLKRMIDKDTLEGFELFNQALKQKVESL